MNIPLMRRIDHFIGIPLCLFLSFHNKFLRPVIVKLFFLKKKFREPKNILVMKYLGAGSIILSSPMIRALRTKFPKAKIIFLTFEKNKEIVEMYNLADELIILRSNNIFIFFSDIIKAIFYFRKKGIDIAIDLEFFAKFSIILTYLTEAPTRVGFYLRQMWRGNLLTHHVYYNPYHHIKQVFIALAETLDVEAKGLDVSKPVISKEDRGFVLNLLARHDISSKDDLICVNVNVGDMCIERRWPSANFAKVVEELNRLNLGKFVFIGSKEDKQHTHNVTSLLKKKDNIVDLSGFLNFKQLSALLERAKFLITCDSGPLHIAVSLGVPTISFFGPETPVLYGPDSQKHMVFYKNLYCSPCLNVYNVKTAMYGDKRCFEGENRCMQAITPDEVLKVIKDKIIL